jgi:hypothetical protein
VAHLVDVLALVTLEGEAVPTTFAGILDWAKGKGITCRGALQSDDVSFIDITNPSVYSQLVLKSGYGSEEEVKKTTKRGDLFKRPGKDHKGDVQTRVMDRAAVKAASARAAQTLQAQKAKKRGDSRK